MTGLLDKYKNIGCKMSLNGIVLRSHLNFFPENLGAMGDEQGECFSQDIFNM